MRGFIVNIVATAIGFYVADFLIDGITVSQTGDAGSNIISLLVIAFIFGLINALIKPIVSLFSLPITILTLGLFALIINAGMLMLTDYFSADLTVDGWIAAILGSIVISIISSVVGGFFGRDED